ncbi:hypothetical protein ROU88_09625 [Macrococcus capreoli]
MDIRDMEFQINFLQLKINALHDHATNHLSSLETMLEQDFIKSNPVTQRCLVEQMRDVYITTTVISDIEKDIERLYEEFNKEKAQLHNQPTKANM